MEQLWIWTLHPDTPTPLHLTMWMGHTEGKGFVLDLGAMLAINKIEIVQGVFWDDAGVRDFKFFSATSASGPWVEFVSGTLPDERWKAKPPPLEVFNFAILTT